MALPANDFFNQLIAPTIQTVVNAPQGIPAGMRKDSKSGAPIHLVPMDSRLYINYFLSHLPWPAVGGNSARQRVNTALGWIAPPAAPPARPLVNIPDVDAALTMSSEGDVVRAAQLALIAPVETLIRRIYDLPANPGTVAGVTDFWSTAEETNDKNRTDLAWYVTTNNAGVISTRCVLVLEFKKRATLKIIEWMTCMGNQIDPANWRGTYYNDDMLHAMMPKGASLVGQAPTLALQAVRYQTSIADLAPRRVVLFDYDTMVVLQFPGVQPNQYNQVLGIVWQGEMQSAYRGLVNTGVFDTLRDQDEKSGGGDKRNTIGTMLNNNYTNTTALNRAGTPIPVLTPAGQRPLDGSFREMLLVCLMDGIENPVV